MGGCIVRRELKVQVYRSKTIISDNLNIIKFSYPTGRISLLMQNFVRKLDLPSFLEQASPTQILILHPGLSAWLLSQGTHSCQGQSHLQNPGSAIFPRVTQKNKLVRDSSCAKKEMRFPFVAGERREGRGGAVWVERGGRQQDDCGDFSRDRGCRQVLAGQWS